MTMTSPWEIFYYICEAGIIFLLYGTMLSFLRSAVVEFIRRYRALTICHTLIDTNRNPELHYAKLLPVIDLTDPQQIHNWIYLRLGVTDVGMKYFRRLGTITTFILSLSYIFLGMVALAYFRVFEMGISDHLLVFGGYDVVVNICCFFLLMIFGAYGNLVYLRDHTTLLELITNLRLIVYQLRSGEFEKFMDDPEGGGKFGYATSHGPVYAHLLELLRVRRQNMGENYTKEKLIDHLQILIFQVDFVIGKLRFQNDNNPFKVIGNKASFESVKSYAFVYFALVLSYLEQNSH